MTEVLPSKTESVDSTEQYYAHMESDRNAAEAAYFDARPMIDREGTPVTTFRAGFERAYQLLWNDLQSSRRETDRACQEYRELNAKYVQDMRATSGETTVDLNAVMWDEVRAAIVDSPRFAEMYAAGGMLNDGVASVVSWLRETPDELAPEGDWLWGQLMDWCSRRRVHPSEYSDLFAIVGKARQVKTSCTAPSIDKPAQLITGAPECPKCRTQLAFEGDVCGLCN